MSQFKEHALAHIVGGLIVAIIVGLFGLMSGFFVDFSSSSLLVTLACVFAACILTVGVGIYLNKKFNPLRPDFAPIDVDFQITRKEIIYEYKNVERTHLHYSKMATIRALKAGLTCYPDKYLWTGRGQVLPTVGNATHTFRETIRKNVWQFYEIIFNHPLDQEKEEIVILNFDLHDPEKKAVPFFSATIEEPTNLLILDLTLPQECGVHEVECEESWSIGAKKPYDSKTKHLKNGKVRWEIPDPKLLHHYEMKWTFPPQK